VKSARHLACPLLLRCIDVLFRLHHILLNHKYVTSYPPINCSSTNWWSPAIHIVISSCYSLSWSSTSRSHRKSSTL
jgi:hypothetical protein